MKQKEIAERFSHGKFSEVFAFLNTDIIWDVIGENSYSGIETVKAICEQTENYFKSVETNFQTKEIIESPIKVIITRTAEFKREGKRVNFIAACVIYKFDESAEIIKISSYCIPENKTN